MILIFKNLYLTNGYAARRLLHEFPDKGWNLGSIDISQLKRSHKTGTGTLTGNQAAADHILLLVGRTENVCAFVVSIFHCSTLLKICFGPTKNRKWVTDLIDLSRHVQIDLLRLMEYVYKYRAFT